jgi:hypothetical protein
LHSSKPERQRKGERSGNVRRSQGFEQTNEAKRAHHERMRALRTMKGLKMPPVVSSPMMDTAEAAFD